MVLAAFAFTALLFVLFWIFGRSLMFLLKVEPEGTDLRQAYALAAGVALFSAMLFVLCLLHAYFLPGAIVGAILLLAASALLFGRRLFGEAQGAAARLNKKSLAAVGVCVLATLPGLLLSPLPPFYKDSLIYHLYIPKEMIAARTFVEIPGLSNTNFPLGMELIQGVGLMAGLPETARILHYFFFWALLFVAWRIGNRFGKGCGPVAALVTALTPSMQIVATWAYIDVALAMITVTALAAICDEKLHADARGLAFIGLLLGFTLWMKFLSLYLAAYAAVLLFIALYGRYRKPGNALARTVLMGVAAGLFASPWYIKNLIQTGNPVYPYFTNLFGGKLFWDEQYSNTYFYLLSNYGYGKGIAKYLFAPWYMIRHARFESIVYDGVIGWVYLPLMILMVVAALGFRRRPVLVQVFSLAALMGYLLWLTNSQQMRFLLPTVALAPILAMAGLTRLFNEGKARRWALGLIALLSLGGLGEIGRYWQSVDPVSYLTGRESRHEFLVRIDPIMRTYDYINENLPNESRIFLVLVKNKRFYLDRPGYSDSIFEHFTLQQAIRNTGSVQGLRDWMKNRPFTHILFDSYYTPKALEPGEMELFKTFIETGTRPLFQDGYFLLVEIL